jgi:hypothetical protein
MPTSRRRRLVGLIAAATCVATSAARAQATSVQDGEKVSPLFRSETPLAVTFTASIGQLRDDKRHGDKAPWRGATLTYQRGDSAPVRVPTRAKVHGIWRLAHCEFPPLRLNFAGKDTRSTVFAQVDKPKLTSYCKDTDAYEQYVLQELQLYRIYQLLTPTSHRVRLLRVTYADSGSGRTEAVRYGFLLEDPDQLAARLGGKISKLKGAGIGDFEESSMALVYMFQYLIGNTDFSFNQQHNGEIVALPDGQNLPVAYDFDFSGAVNARYATPDPSIRIRRVRERKFRGYCQQTAEFAKAIPLFQQKKDAIYALYADEIGRLMDPVIVRETLEYFNEFYDAIGDPGKAERVIFRDCLGPR